MIPYSKISEHELRKIIKHFCIDIDATKTSELLGYNRKTINRYFGIFRECQALLFSFIWFFHFLFYEFLFFFILFSESSRRISESCMQSLCIIVGNLSVYCQYESFHTFVFLRLSEFKLEFPIIGFLCSVLPRRSLTAHRNAYMIHP